MPVQLCLLLIRVKGGNETGGVDGRDGPGGVGVFAIDEVMLGRAGAGNEMLVGLRRSLSLVGCRAGLGRVIGVSIE